MTTSRPSSNVGTQRSSHPRRQTPRCGLPSLPRFVPLSYTGDTGFLLREHPDELVSPDVAFVRRDRLRPPAERIGYLRVVPDLVVEIRSPNDAEADVRAKLSVYLEVGLPLVWLVDPQKQTVEEVRASASGVSDSRLRWADASQCARGWRSSARRSALACRRIRVTAATRRRP